MRYDLTNFEWSLIQPMLPNGHERFARRSIEAAKGF